MKIIFHERYYEVYTTDPAAAAGRMEAIMGVLGKDFHFVTPPPAADADLALVHTPGHIETIKKYKDVYEVGILSAGGAILAAQMAYDGGPAFGLIRPPGHHASPDSCWGFCYFNNMAIALRKLMKEGKIKKALVLDFDLHFGDGTENAFMGNPNVDYFHPEGSSNKDFFQMIEKHLERSANFDILAVSAGLTGMWRTGGDCWKPKITGRSVPWSKPIPKRSATADASGSLRAATTTMSWGTMCGLLSRG
jgi:hypothetical protein